MPEFTVYHTKTVTQQWEVYAADEEDALNEVKHGRVPHAAILEDSVPSVDEEWEVYDG